MQQSKALDLPEKIELFLCRKANATVSVTDTFKAQLIDRGVHGSKIHVVTDGVESSRFTPSAKDAALVVSLGLENKFVAGYIGTHGLAHALDTLLDAATMLAAREGEGRWRIILLGDYSFEIV